MDEFTNNANGNKVPILYRVPVTTIVGYYEPDSSRSLQSYVYPALHGAYDLHTVMMAVLVMVLHMDVN